MELMSQPATSVRSHCLSPARARVTIDAALGPTSYARMFPKLPSFQADEQFLLMLGRAGGVCDRGDIDDSPDSLADTAAASANLWLTTLRLTGPSCDLMPIRRNCTMRAARNSILNACTAMDRPAIRSSTSVTIQRSFCLVWIEQTCSATRRVSQ